MSHKKTWSCIKPDGDGCDGDHIPEPSTVEEYGLRFKACRINGTAYVELFEGKKALALIYKTKDENKDSWDSLYKKACAESDRLNSLLGCAREKDALILALTTIKKDYSFMITLIERYSTDKESSLKDILERLKFRQPLFKVLEDK